MIWAKEKEEEEVSLGSCEREQGEGGENESKRVLTRRGDNLSVFLSTLLHFRQFLCF